MRGRAEVLASALGGTWHGGGHRCVRRAAGGALAAAAGPHRRARVRRGGAPRSGPAGAAHASSRGFGELILGALAARPARLLLCLGGTATMDGGAGLREVVRELPAPPRAPTTFVARCSRPPACSGRRRAPRRRMWSSSSAGWQPTRSSRPYAGLAGSGAAGGLGAALASLGAELVPGAPHVLEALGLAGAPQESTSSSRAREPSTHRPRRARRRPRSPVPRGTQGCAASCSAAASSSRWTAPRPSRSRAIPRVPPRTSRARA